MSEWTKKNWKNSDTLDCFLAVLAQNANDVDKEKQSFPATADSEKRENLTRPNIRPKPQEE